MTNPHEQIERFAKRLGIKFFWRTTRFMIWWKRQVYRFNPLRPVIDSYQQITTTDPFLSRFVNTMNMRAEASVLWVLLFLVIGFAEIAVFGVILSALVQLITFLWNYVPEEGIWHKTTLIAVVTPGSYILYRIKTKWLYQYALLEMAAGLVVIAQAADKLLIDDPFALAAVFAAIYFFVRGFENFAKAIDATPIAGPVRMQ